jgi:hypothetical protein
VPAIESTEKQIWPCLSKLQSSSVPLVNSVRLAVSQSCQAGEQLHMISMEQQYSCCCRHANSPYVPGERQNSCGSAMASVAAAMFMLLPAKGTAGVHNGTLTERYGTKWFIT